MGSVDRSIIKKNRLHGLLFAGAAIFRPKSSLFRRSRMCNYLVTKVSAVRQVSNGRIDAMLKSLFLENFESPEIVLLLLYPVDCGEGRRRRFQLAKVYYRGSITKLVLHSLFVAIL
jgi:hypothetical protein